MSTNCTVVVNNAGGAQDFFIFQAPVTPSYLYGPPPGSELTVYSNSLGTFNVPSKDEGSDGAVFVTVSEQFVSLQYPTSLITVGQPPSHAPIINQAITPTSATSSENNYCAVRLAPLGFVNPGSAAGVPEGAFRIDMSNNFSPMANIGSSVQVIAKSEAIVLSSFWNNVYGGVIFDCLTPHLLYVQVGNAEAGTVIDFASASKGAAVCDCSGGRSCFTLVYNPIFTNTPQGPFTLMPEEN
ncbi:MAG: hypothetical protein ACN6QH_25295 [Pseudomonas sp.]|uniref:hypothetical protein n=1 Tax=Pseudomonas sp. TaxID=306 RepID=UPI003D0ADAFC